MVDKIFNLYKTWSGQPDINKPQGKKMNPEMNEKEFKNEVMNMFTGTDTEVLGVKSKSSEVVSMASAGATKSDAANTNPFADNTSTSAQATIPARLAAAVDESAKIKVVKTDSYPFIAKDGSVKIGLAIVIKEEDNMADAFGDAEAGQEAMIIIDSTTGKTVQTEMPFKKESLNAKMKVIPQEVFENLENVRKTVTLSKVFKNLQNKNYDSIINVNMHDDERMVLNRSIKQAADLSANIISKISESTGDDLEGMLTSYKFKKHLLVTGDAGEGKTFIVDKFLKDHAIKNIMYISHTGTEAIDLIGHYIKKPDGTFIWKDGTFSKAFRLAQTEPVAYFLDEMLRMPARELNILVGSLTPDSSGNLRLRTDRHVNEVGGIADTEELVVPQENLWVIATTNQGSGYQSARIDEALKDRFRLYYQRLGADKVEEVITAKMVKHKASPVATKSLISLIQKTNEIKSTGNIPRAFTIRHLTEAVDNALSLKDIKKKMFELVPNIVSIDSTGEFNKEQVEIIRSLIKKTL